MNARLAYFGRSEMQGHGRSRTLNLVPNLAREPVAFDAPLLKPMRFREAISALHDVVISDLRYQPRDKTAYEAWKKGEQERLSAMRRDAYKQAKLEILATKDIEVPADLERQYSRCRSRYWKARQDYTSFLWQHDVALLRKFMPFDPVVTIADDVAFFECFSADESSYGCLTAERGGAFGPSPTLQFGTTNVDYSWDLYNNFQSLRSYRETRFRVDPHGFEVATAGSADYREEKIDLPAGWLRGFMQIQVAMGLPMRRVSLSREAVYSILAWLKRHKARKSPRAIRFELLPDSAPRIVLEPWEQPIVSHGTRYHGPSGEPIRVWGGRRLLALARLLPLVERFDVYLLGTGLPSFWVANMGEMRLTLGISGWTTNDWTHGSALDMLAPPASASSDLVSRAADFLRDKRAATFDEVRAACGAEPANCAVAVNRLAHSGQAIYDLAAQRYRWRQVMPQALGEAELGPENPELLASRQLVVNRRVKIDARSELGNGMRLVTGAVEGKPVELLLDTDGGIKRAKCLCGHHKKAGLRMGPCRHLLAARQVVLQGGPAEEASAVAWYEKLRRWTNI